MNVAWPAAGAVAALPAATVVRGRVYRLSVPGGACERAACLACAAPLPGLPALRCWSCGTWLGVPAAIELTAAAVTALLFARFGTAPALAAFAYLGVIAVALAQVDGAVRRLPDSLTLPACPALIVLLGLAAAAGQDGGALLRALLGGRALSGGFLLLGLASGGQVGGGQVGGGGIKLAGLVRARARLAGVAHARRRCRARLLAGGRAGRRHARHPARVQAQCHRRRPRHARRRPARNPGQRYTLSSTPGSGLFTHMTAARWSGKPIALRPLTCIDAA